MVGFQMFPGLHPNYVFVTEIPKMLILWFTFLTLLPWNRHDMFFFSLNVSYCFWQIVLLNYREQASAHICTLYYFQELVFIS